MLKGDIVKCRYIKAKPECRNINSIKRAHLVHFIISISFLDLARNQY